MCFGKAVPALVVTSVPAPGITQHKAAGQGCSFIWDFQELAPINQCPNELPVSLEGSRAESDCSENTESPFQPSRTVGEGQMGTNPSLNTEKEDSAVRAPISS